MGDSDKEYRPDRREEAGPGTSFLDAVLELKLEGPPDWSENLDQYLYDESVSTHD